jgi:hypothetical protein
MKYAVEMGSDIHTTSILYFLKNKEGRRIYKL